MKGPPLPPLQKVPAAAGDLTVLRFDQDVFLRFTVPSTNVEGIGIATIDRIEVYGITLDVPLAQRDAETEAVRGAATLISSQHVRIPPPPPDPEQPPPPPVPQEPGLDQGGPAVAYEQITEEMRTPVDVPALTTPPPVEGVAVAEEADQAIAPAPTFVAEEMTGLRRYYFVVGVTKNGRYGRATAPVALPLARATGATSAPTVTYTERDVRIRWAPAANARVAPARAEGVLPSRPLTPPPPPTRYDVFAVSKTPRASDAVPTAPAPLNEAPLTATELVVPGVKFGAEQCYAVRPVDSVAGVIVRGPSSPVTCETPRDTFAPAAPTALAAVAGAGSISLIWEPNAEPDLAGYIVLRGEAGTERLTPLTKTPIRETTYRDETVRAGTRYVYAIVAVDNAAPPNSSEPSARVEETARQ